MKNKALSNKYDESTLKEIFGMDIIKSCWRTKTNHYHEAMLGYGGNICLVCGAPIIISINSHSDCYMPFKDHDVINHIKIHTYCARCGYHNIIEELYEPAILPILAELNIKDLYTVMSCQGHDKDTHQYSDLVSPDTYETLIKNRYNGGGNRLWISFRYPNDIKRICEKYPLPDEFNFSTEADYAFIKCDLSDKDPIKTRMTLYNWTLTLPKSTDLETIFPRTGY